MNVPGRIVRNINGVSSIIIKQIPMVLDQHIGYIQREGGIKRFIEAFCKVIKGDDRVVEGWFTEKDEGEKRGSEAFKTATDTGRYLIKKMIGIEVKRHKKTAGQRLKY
jgi:hypothetical protein